MQLYWYVFFTSIVLQASSVDLSFTHWHSLNTQLRNLSPSEYRNGSMSPWNKKLTCPDSARPLRLFMTTDVRSLSTVQLSRVDSECSIAFVPGYVENRDELVEVSHRFEGVFVEDVSIVPYEQSEGKLHFFDRVEYAEKSMRVMADKRKLLSVIFPTWHAVTKDNELRWRFDKFNIPEMSEHLYFEDQSGQVAESAFLDYHFCFIVQSLEKYPEYPPVPVVRAFENHCAMIVRTQDPEGYWLPLGFTVVMAIWREEQLISYVNLANTMENLIDLVIGNATRGMDRMILAKQINIRLTQDFWLQKYSLHAEQRLHVHACNVCTAQHKVRQRNAVLSNQQLDNGCNSANLSCKRRIRNVAADGPLVFLAIMSAKRNWLMRETIRQTWLRVLKTESNQFEYDYKFFICAKSEDEEDEGLRMEQKKYDDVVYLECVEQYRQLHFKVFGIYEWTVDHIRNASFFFRLDDDVYLRPQPIFDQLKRRTPSRYWWGSFAHLSGVVRDETDTKEFVTREEYPLAELYPLYARGPFNVLSFDLVEIIVQNKYALHRNMPQDDVATGIFIFQLFTRRQIHVYMDDRDENRLVVNHYCSQLQSTTWAVHHVSNAQMLCMWNIDIHQGVYNATQSEDQGVHLPAVITGPRRNGWPDVCPCASKLEGGSNQSQITPLAGRFAPYSPSFATF